MVYTCKWLLTWYIVSPSTFISFSTPLGVAPVKRKWEKIRARSLRNYGLSLKREKKIDILSLPPSWLTASTNAS